MMDVIMVSHKTVSFILKYSPFKHQMNKIFLPMVLTWPHKFIHIWVAYDFFKAALAVYFISWHLALSTLSQLLNINLLLYNQDHHEYTACLVYAGLSYDSFFFYYQFWFSYSLSLHAGLSQPIKKYLLSVHCVIISLHTLYFSPYHFNS